MEPDDQLPFLFQPVPDSPPPQPTTPQTPQQHPHKQQQLKEQPIPPQGPLCQRCHKQAAEQRTKLCQQCSSHGLSYRCRLYFKKKLPERHEGVLLAFSGNIASLTLAAVIAKVRSTVMQKETRGIEARMGAVIIAPDVALVDKTYRDSFLEHFGFPLAVVQSDQVGPSIDRFAKENNYQFVVKAKCCDEIATSVLTDFFKGQNPVRHRPSLFPFEEHLQADIEDYYKNEGITLKPLSLLKQQSALESATRMFLGGLQEGNCQTVRTITRMK